MSIKALRLIKLLSLLHHVVWSTGPFGGMTAPVDCPSRDSGHGSVDHPFRDFEHISQRYWFLPLRALQTISQCVDGSIEPSFFAYRRLTINVSLKDASLIFIQ